MSGSAVHVDFERQAQLAPDAVAIVTTSSQITYDALNSLANQVAHKLIKAGVRPGDFVGVCLERSIAQVASVLGALKAGATYVPLDTEYPPERIAYMVADAGLKACLATGSSIERLGLNPAIAIRFDNADDLAAMPAANPALPGADDQLIYMIYTSGSTGKPKGALVYHRGFTNLVDWYRSEFGFDSSTVTLLMSSPAFDLTQKNLFAPLAAGGRLCLLDEGVFDAATVGSLIQRWGVTTANCTPSAFVRILDAGGSGNYEALSSLRYVFLGGEPIVVARLINWLRSKQCHAKIVNSYGPTECTDVCAWFRIDEPERYVSSSVPIGHAVPGFDLRIVDESLREVPTGSEGQLVIAGIGVGKGYHGRPDLTAERFLANPFGGDSRLYLSGDLARRLDDGSIDYLGRIDTQVKIRGFRIELGEIETALESNAAIANAAVAAFPGANGENRLAAYLVVAAGQAQPELQALRLALVATLPEYMVPSSWQFIDALPLTPNGKLDRKALPAPGRSRPPLGNPLVAPATDTERYLAALWRELLDIDAVGSIDSFFELGGTSLLAMDVLAQLNNGLGLRASVTTLFDNPTLSAFAQQLWQRHAKVLRERFPNDAGAAAPAQDVFAPARAPTHDDIAIIGVAGRFPGALTVSDYWTNLCSGVESTTQFTDASLDPSIPAELRADTDYVKARALIPEPDLFDAGFFGMSAREAAVTDPQQRIFLETAWQALEDAAIVPAQSKGRIGVYAGVGVNTYFITNVLPAKGPDAGIGEIARIIATEKDYVANRLSYKLNLTGPAVSVHTACSTSLVAVIEAINSLRLGQCEVAIAGGVSVHTPLNSGYLFQTDGALSPDGISRPFSKESAGTSFNSGAGVVVLKPKAAAMADGDRIYAVIRGVGINNDGADKASFMAPSVRGQMAAIVQAQRDAGIDPRTISYVEAHGTATPIGDPIEVEALTQAFRLNSDSEETGYCALGSVKGNFGHLVAAAGTAGLIKVALALQHRKIPPTVNYREPNPLIDFASSPFFVTDRLMAWEQNGNPLRAAVSSFGIGGTNAHVVVEQAPVVEASNADSDQPELLLLSARNNERLDVLTDRLADSLQDGRLAAADVAWTLQRGRARFAHRRVCVGTSAELAQSLRGRSKTAVKTRQYEGRTAGVVFMFPGQGSQYVGMGLGLYQRFAGFRATVDECCELLLPLLDCDLRDVLFPAVGIDEATAAERLRQTQYTQPALFVIEYALARLWMEFGIQPVALVGHSIGEFVAATLAGVFSLADGLKLVASRASLMQAQPSGAMYSVRAAAASVQPQLPPSCDVAAINGPQLCVIAGPHDDIAKVVAALAAKGIETRALHTSHAFHSPMMDGVIAPFSKVVDSVTLQAPRIPLMSTVDANWLDAKRATDRSYWSQHLRRTVRFADGVAALLQGEPAIYLEVGPRNVTATLAAQQMAPTARQPVLTSLGAVPVVGDLAGEQRVLLLTAGELWSHGHELQWAALHNARPAIVSLPHYPFARDRHWIDVKTPAAMPQAPASASPAPAALVTQPLLNPQLAASGINAMTAPPVPVAAVSTTVTDCATTESTAMSQHAQLINDLRELFTDSSGEDLSHATPETSFLELGFDSLFLTQAALALKKRYRIDLPFRRLLSDAGDFGSLASVVQAEADPSVLPSAVAPVPVAAAAAAPVQQPQAAPAQAFAQPVAVQSQPVQYAPQQPMAALDPSQLSSMQGLIQQQIQLMARQLEMLGGGAPAANIAYVPAAASAPVAAAQPAVAPAASPAVPAAAAPATASAPSAAAGEERPPAKPFGAQARIDVSSKDDFGSQQREHYRQLVSEYTQFTAKSRAFTEKTRPFLADPRVVSGFRPAVKDITYPIVVDRSKGSRLWDIDGNEYIDTLCGYGSMFFGYQPDWIVSALNEQLEKGMEIGPQHPMTLEVIELLQEFLPHERYAFCNTGSEAVLGAMRMTRTRSGRDKIVMFTGDYHGIVDEVIVRGGRNLKSFPAAAGIMPDAVKNMLVLDYGSDEALQIIRDNADDIAAVLVEPVQSRHPGLVPIEFLKKLRVLTEETGIALIFDEVITGFRTAPGGFQQYSGIQADICTYGKVIGGGISLGIIAGRAHYLDTLDGGAWQFGDDSKPEIGVTYFAGTFVRHPLALAAAKAVLLHMKEKGPQLQQRANDLAEQHVRDLNLHFKRVNAPMEIERFSSLMYFKFTQDLPWGELMFCDMRRQGIHAWYGRPMFVSCAHTEEDLAQIRNVFMRSLARMQEWGFIPGSSRDVLGRDLAPPVNGAKLGIDAEGNPAWFVSDPDASSGLRQVGASFE